MTAVVQDMPNSTSERNTGFPEPLSPDRNTTLPHPEADLNNAVIEGTALRKTHSRNRSFRRNHSHLNSGKIIDDKALYADIQYADGTKEKRSSEEIEADLKRGNTSSSDGNDGAKTSEDSHEVDRKGLSDDGDSDGSKRKRGLLRKLRLHK